MKSFLIVIKKSSSTKKKLRNVTKTKLTEMKLKSMVPARQLFSIPPLIIIAQSRTCCNFQSELSNRRLISDEIRETRNRWRQCGENFFPFNNWYYATIDVSSLFVVIEGTVRALEKGFGWQHAPLTVRLRGSTINVCMSTALLKMLIPRVSQSITFRVAELSLANIPSSKNFENNFRSLRDLKQNKKKEVCCRPMEAFRNDEPKSGDDLMFELWHQLLDWPTS